MKFNPRSARVWLTYAVAGFNLMLGIVLSPLIRRRKGPIRVVLYGHHFYGNLRAFYEGADWREHGLDCRFVYIDHRQYRRHRRSSPGILGSFRPDHMLWIAGADIIMTDRGLGLLTILARLRPGIETVQMWHGVGYKGFSRDELRSFRKYSVALVASEAVRNEWHQGGDGLPLDRLMVTGFARTDELLVPRAARSELEHQIGLSSDADARVLMAPTWKSDDTGLSVVPFGMSAKEFLGTVDDWATSRRIEVVFRMHLNTEALSQAGHEVGRVSLRSIRLRSMHDYPRTEDLLIVSDVLVSDWSSVAADFLVLDRPIVFLDVPPPFRHGFSVLGYGDRPGDRVASMEELFEALEIAVAKPPASTDRHADERARVRAIAFGDTLDGRSAARSLDAILSLVGGQYDPLGY